jgi:hypothetical protein
LSAQRTGLAVVAAFVVAGALFGLRRGGTAPRGPAADEREIVRHQLGRAATGSIEIAYYLSFPAQPDAERVAASLRAGAFTVAPEAGPPERPWRLSARARIPATAEAVIAAKEIVAGTASLNGGTYEGWEAVR